MWQLQPRCLFSHLPAQKLHLPETSTIMVNTRLNIEFLIGIAKQFPPPQKKTETQKNKDKKTHCSYALQVRPVFSFTRRSKPWLSSGRISPATEHPLRYLHMMHRAPVEMSTHFSPSTSQATKHHWGCIWGNSQMEKGCLYHCMMIFQAMMGCLYH